MKSTMWSLNRKKIIIVIFTIQTFLGMGWIASYPYAGYVILVLWAISFLFFRYKPLSYVIYGLIVGFVVVFYLFPRTYGSGNVAWHLMLLVFSQFIFLDRGHFSQIFILFTKSLIFLCIASLLVRICIYFGLNYPYTYINLDPQDFNLYWPFYIERLFTSGDISMSLLGNFRFHGPFFEPGALGIALGVSLYSDLNRWKLALIIFFGTLSLSMAFFFIGFVRLVEYTVLKKGYKTLGLIIALGFCVFLLLDKDSFIYASTFGRFLGTNDKVLNTRNSIYELEQILLFSQTFSYNIWGSLVGIGWDTPGSGGSYRVWLLGSGFVGLILWLFAYLRLLNKLIGIDLNSVVFRIPCLVIICYIWGNWMSPILLFLWYKRNRFEL